MEADEYIAQRLDGQQKWYSRKSKANKKYHYAFNVLTIIFSILIPVILALGKYLSEVDLSTAIASVLGALVAIFTAISGLMKFKDKWITYRACSEQLKKEKYLYETGTVPYDKPNALNALVQRVEQIISSENADWGEYIAEEQKP